MIISIKQKNVRIYESLWRTQNEIHFKFEKKKKKRIFK